MDLIISMSCWLGQLIGLRTTWKLMQDTRVMMKLMQDTRVMMKLMQDTRVLMKFRNYDSMDESEEQIVF